MNKEKIIQGYDSDVCNIDLALVLDTVVISNHPIMMQRAMAYSNHSIQTWLTGSGYTCPLTREQLSAQDIKLTSIQMEVTMFLLEAEKHLALLGPEERGQKDDIKSTLQKLRSEHASLVEQATANLEKLKKDDRVDLSLESIGSLIGLGVPGNYKTQCGYAADLNQQNPKPKAAATSSKQEPILNEEPKKEVASPPSASNNTPESRSAILRGLKSLWNQIISALVAIKKGVYTLASKLVAPFRRNNARRTRETPATTTTHRPEVVPQQQYTFNIQLPPPPSRSTPTSIFMPPSTAHILQRLQRERDESHRFANQQFERVRREMDDPNSFVNQRLQRMRREMDDPNGFVNQRLQQMHSHHHSYGSRPYSGQRFHQG